ncbi:hypothetical protein [Loktanella sp. S4079]|uniref:hypothetical protein n=1 Tax=Loktanella sp. S4079 TaxID=579483 RepID=UPI0005FA5978|nr:hypothetical protein [Loktanella sp. S4079]KJZ20597.1 hypothetical protein TW80_07440 [Loktanella sp. S4079]
MNRHGRRKANSGKSKPLKYFKKNVTEIFTTPDLRGHEVSLIVAPMRKWAEENLQPMMHPFSVEMVNYLISTGTVELETLEKRTIHMGLKPIIICESENGLGEVLVDGNHTYVMAALAHEMAQREGNPSIGGIPSYTLRPHEWAQFVVQPPT